MRLRAMQVNWFSCGLPKIDSLARSAFSKGLGGAVLKGLQEVFHITGGSALRQSHVCSNGCNISDRFPSVFALPAEWF